MSITYTKLFSSITESTIWCENSDTRVVWVTMLAMSDKRGRVWASVPGLANRARVSVSKTRYALDKFMSTDKDSRTPDYDGRRIMPIDGGWQLLNHKKYRDLRDEEERKAYKADWIRQKREEERQSVDQSVDNVDKCRPQSTYTDPAPAPDPYLLREMSAKADPPPALKAKKGKSLPKTWTLPEDWEAWTIENCPRVDPIATAEEFKDWALANANRQVGRKSDWFATWRNWCRRDQEKYAEKAKWRNK